MISQGSAWCNVAGGAFAFRAHLYYNRSIKKKAPSGLAEPTPWTGTQRGTATMSFAAQGKRRCSGQHSKRRGPSAAKRLAISLARLQSRWTGFACAKAVLWATRRGAQVKRLGYQK